MTKRGIPQSTSSQNRTRPRSKHNGSSVQVGKQSAALPRPQTEDRNTWHSYWRAQKQSWRTEPEIDEDRQEFLTECMAKIPDIADSIYPFKDIRLSRADIEWLLATHENGCAPVDCNDEDQLQLGGLDLRGADLRGVDLSNLPLARMCGGLDIVLWPPTITEKSKVKKITLDDACFQAAVHLEGANLQDANLEDACLHRAHLEQANLFGAHLERIDLAGAHLEQADLSYAHLEQADLSHAHLEQADLSCAHLEGVSLEGAQLGGASLCGVFFNNATRLNSMHLISNKFGVALVVDIHWCDVNVAVLSWSDIDKLGDELLASKRKWADGAAKSKTIQVQEYHEALRANRQIAIVLRNQGLNEEADHFAYRAQLLERVLWRQQRRWLKLIFSWFLYLLAGYGYRPLRSIILYLLVVFGFAVSYFEVTHLLHAQPYPLAWYEALILSVSSFHGRGFFQPVQNLGDPVAILASIEAVFGLLIEISFIATFTQRFFGK